MRCWPGRSPNCGSGGPRRSSSNWISRRASRKGRRPTRWPRCCPGTGRGSPTCSTACGGPRRTPGSRRSSPRSAASTSAWPRCRNCARRSGSSARRASPRTSGPNRSGSSRSGNLPYYLATAFDQIFLQPSGGLGLTGIMVEQLFLRSALDKVGVSFEAAQRKEYKTAAHPLTERGFTAARPGGKRAPGRVHRRAAHQRHRRTAREDARPTRGPCSTAARSCRTRPSPKGSSTRWATATRSTRRSAAQAGPDAVLQYVGRYQRTRTLAQRARKLPNPRERYVAVIYASGPIRQGRSGRGPMSGPAIGSDTVAGALRAAAADERAAGHPAPGQQPRRLVHRVRHDLARSRARPGRRHAGRGVHGRRRGVRRVLHRDGRGRDHRAAGDDHRLDRRGDRQARRRGPAEPGRDHHRPGGRGRARPDVRPRPTRSAKTSGPSSTPGWTTSTPTSPARWRRAAGLSGEQVREVARGRVWTGADAVQNGLADSLGGLAEAAQAARRRGGLPADAPLRACSRGSPRWISCGRTNRARTAPRRRPAACRRSWPGWCPAWSPGSGRSPRPGAGLAAGRAGGPVAVRAADAAGFWRID